MSEVDKQFGQGLRQWTSKALDIAVVECLGGKGRAESAAE